MSNVPLFVWPVGPIINTEPIRYVVNKTDHDLVVDTLREQNRVLADERDKLNIAIGQAIVTLRYYAKTAISIRAVDTLERIEAALTATSQEGQHEL